MTSWLTKVMEDWRQTIQWAAFPILIGSIQSAGRQIILLPTISTVLLVWFYYMAHIYLGWTEIYWNSISRPQVLICLYLCADHEDSTTMQQSFLKKRDIQRKMWLTFSEKQLPASTILHSLDILLLHAFHQYKLRSIVNQEQNENIKLCYRLYYLWKIGQWIFVFGRCPLFRCRNGEKYRTWE